MEIKKQKSYEIVLAKLTARFDDASLATMLVAAKNDDNMHTIATNLNKKQLKTWLGDGKSVDDVYKFLSLGKEEGADLLSNLALSTSVFYVKLLNKNPNELLFRELKTRNSEWRQANMLVLAQKNYHSRDTAATMGKLQMQNWLDDGKTASDVFKLLKLNKLGDRFFDSPMGSAWSSYQAKVNKNPDESVYLVLKTQYRDAGLEMQTVEANKRPRAKTIAAKFQEEIWRSEGKTEDDIYSLLKLGKAGDELFESPMLRAWISYVTKPGKLAKKPDEFMVISQLEKHVGEMGLARILGMANKHSTDNATKDVVRELQRLQFKQ